MSVALAGVWLPSLSIAPAADLYWNGAGSSGSAGGGGGIWNASNTNWETLASGGSPVAWTSGDNGFFAGTAGTVDLQASLTAGTLTGTTSGYTLTSTNGSGLTVSAVDISSLAANGQLNVGVKLTGTGGISLSGAGDTTNTGGGNPNQGIRLTNSNNDFVGDVTITNRLISYTSNAVFGAAANKIIMNGGGVLDNNTNGSLSRDIEVQSGGGLIRVWNNTTTWSGAITGSGTIQRIDTGTLNLSGDLSAFSGAYTQNGGGQSIATTITGSGTIGGSWTNSSGTFTFNSASNQTATGILAGAFTKSGAGSLTLSNGTVGGTWTVNTGGGLNIQSNSAQAMAGGISGAGPVTKNGTGALTVTARSSFTGPLTISSGTWVVNVSENDATPSTTGLGDMTQAGRTVTVAAGATLRFDAFDAIGDYLTASTTPIVVDGGTITQPSATPRFTSLGNLELRNGGRITTVNGNGPVTQSFALNGTVTVSGTSGSFIDTVGTTNNGLHLGTNGGTTTFNVGVTGDPTADLIVSAALLDRAVSGAGVLLKAGDGSMRMTASNAYSGGTTVRAGTLVANNNNGFGSGPITVNDGSTGSSNANVLIDASAGTVTLARPITVANQGTGIVTIGASANAGGNFATFSGGITLGRSATLVGPGAGDRTEFTGGISGAGGVTITTSGGTRIIFRDTANSYAGATTITAGSVLQLSDGTATANSYLADAADVTVNGTLNLAKGTNSETVGGLLGSGAVSNLVGGVVSTLVVGGGNRSGTFSGVLSNPSGTLAFTKTGTGTQVLSGSNGYTGATSITGGRLEVASTGVLTGTSGITVNGVGAELRYNSTTPLARSLTLSQGTLSGTGAIATAVSVGTNAVLSPGNSPGTQAFTSGLTWAAGGTYDWELNALAGTPGSQWDLLNVSSGGLNLSGLTASNTFNLNLITLNGANVPGGLVVPYTPGSSHALLIASYDSLSVPSGFSTAAGSDLTSLFAINLTGWVGQQPNLADVSVRINDTANGLTISIVPEPGAIALLTGLGFAAMAGVRLRKPRSR